MTERRYDGEETREIFRLATTGDARDPSVPADGRTGDDRTGDGLTIAELQRIGQEVGVAPARVAQAAAQLDARGRTAPVRRSLGLPVGVERVVDLPRAPTEREWAQLIAVFRSTFGVQGRTTNVGGLHDWSQGNLHIAVEPTEHGEQLRLRTVKSNAVALNTLALGLIAMMVLLATIAIVAGKPEKAIAVVIQFAVLALVAFGVNLVRLPRWAREREAQMESLAEYAVQLLSKP